MRHEAKSYCNYIRDQIKELSIPALSGLWITTELMVCVIPRHTVQYGFLSEQLVCVHVSPKNIFPVFPSTARSAVYIPLHVLLWEALARRATLAPAREERVAVIVF